MNNETDYNLTIETKNGTLEYVIKFIELENIIEQIGYEQIKQIRMTKKGDEHVKKKRI